MTELARERNQAANVQRVFASWQKSSRRPTCTVSVLLPHNLHERYAVRVLEAGKHIVCEKPLASSLAECDGVLAMATRQVENASPSTIGCFNPMYVLRCTLGDVAEVSRLFGDR